MQKLKLFFINNVPFVGGNLGTDYLHGDATFLKFPDGTNALLDAGTTVSGPHIAKKLRDMGVSRLDRFILSHPHADHGDGFAAVADAMDVGEVIWSGCDLNNLSYSPVALNAAEKHGIPVRTLYAGDRLSLGGAELEIFHPAKDVPFVDPAAERAVQGEWVNNNSMVMRLSFGKFSVLFPGDLHMAAEEALCAQYGDRLQSTLLKIPHHGNDTSMSETFFAQVQPRLGISLGRRCIGRIWIAFTEAERTLYATYTDGDITMETDGAELSVSCRKGEKTYLL
ncbi:MAG: MBL fold metallo-hydrolase [Clostridia bacterium]|nr:MBL fold metallo-hydrolase [Clostridia bacterium]